MPILTVPIAAGGPLIDIYVGISRPRVTALQAAKLPVPGPIPARCLIDTGASCTCLDTTVIQALGITPSGSTQILTPSTGTSSHTANQYDVAIIFATPKGGHLFGHTIPVIESDFSSQGIKGLVGRDLLSQCLLSYNGPDGRIVIAV